MDINKVISYIKEKKVNSLYQISEKFNLKNSEIEIIIPFLISNGINFSSIDKVKSVCSECPLANKCSKNKEKGGGGCGL
ncbi:hypothetical protein OSSY52_08950 [Tepiditoga spiralis]|uniref:Transcriptional regulator HTH-type FeoC domain-containing protein n=1 Tax=Tepiditoga spiralis TaxID=2108365 RepID=A0A7G1G6J4_9BACT|nr:hypothetical protein [Tepiditoga spiralis]BBE30754.1 hypothetical protein OSSY52_08950 [Tepiditoga spiralis]